MVVQDVVRGTDDAFETIQDEYAGGRAVLDWARLTVLRLPEASVHEVAVGVELPRSTDVDLVQEWNTYDAVSSRQPRPC